MSEITAEYKNFLTKKYNVLGGIHLVRYDSNLNGLERLLSNLKKDYYDSNDRIVIEHFDTDHYLPDFPYGLTLYNLFVAFRKLNIPLFTMLLITNNFGIDQEVKKLINHPKDCPTVIQTFISNYHYTNYYEDLEIDPSNITMPAMSILGQHRVHRDLVYRFAEKNNLLDKIAISYRK